MALTSEVRRLDPEPRWRGPERAGSRQSPRMSRCLCWEHVDRPQGPGKSLTQTHGKRSWLAQPLDKSGGREDKRILFQKREGWKHSAGFKRRFLCPPPGGTPAARGDLEGLRVSSSRCSPDWWSAAAPQLGQGPDSAREEGEGRSGTETRVRQVRPCHRGPPSIRCAHTIHASPFSVPALQSQSQVELPLDVRPSGPILLP